MVAVKVYNLEGKEVGEEKLNPAVFGVKVKPEIIQQVVVAQQANSRAIIAHTKDRSEVRGGGRKPWRQKGTGRARHGSIRSPLWRGGGVTFGPTKDVNFFTKINKKVKKQAILMSLSDKVAENKLILLESLELPEIKTKKMFSILRNLKLWATKGDKGKKSEEKKNEKKAVKVSVVAHQPKVLLVMDKQNKNVYLSARNIKNLTPIGANSINVVDILKNNYLLMPLSAVKKIEELFGKS